MFLFSPSVLIVPSLHLMLALVPSPGHVVFHVVPSSLFISHINDNDFTTIILKLVFKPYKFNLDLSSMTPIIRSETCVLTLRRFQPSLIIYDNYPVTLVY